MATFTYEQFQQAAQDSGLLNSFSQADLSLAQRNPDAGMSILTAKKDWMNATTDEQRALANQRAEEIRSSFGEYTGGTTGAGFTLTPLSPNHFQYGDAPTWSGGSFSDDVKNLWDQQLNYGDFTYGEAPTYTSRYDQTIQDMIQGILDREDFTYNPSTDPLYQNYRQQYIREGQRATQDAMGAAAAASGGIPSSYASTAAGQAGNYYNAQLTDKIPELYQLAYNQYLNDYQMDLSDLGVVQGQEATDYGRYQDQLAQYNTDRNFAYNQYLNGFNMLNTNLQTALGMNNQEWQQYLTQLDQYNTDRNFAYNQLLDEIDSQANERNEAINNAILAGQYGDYSQLNDLGINTDNADWERRYQLAILAAEYGDYSGLRELGINPQLQTYTYSGGGGSSGGSSGGSGGGSGGGSSDGNYPNLTNYPDNQVNAVMGALQQAYPNGVIPNLEWNSLVQNGYTAEQLTASGFTRGTSSTGTTPSGATGGTTAGASGLSGLSSTDRLNLGTAALKAGVTAGMNGTQAAQRIESALNSGRITDAEASALLSMYGF